MSNSHSVKSVQAAEFKLLACSVSGSSLAGPASTNDRVYSRVSEYTEIHFPFQLKNNIYF